MKIETISVDMTLDEAQVDSIAVAAIEIAKELNCPPVDKVMIIGYKNQKTPKAVIMHFGGEGHDDETNI